MKQKLIGLFMLSMAFTTSCNNEIAPETTEKKVPISFSINIGNAITTYATASDQGGWSNYKNDVNMDNSYNCRAILQLYAENDNTPFVDKRTIITDAANAGSAISDIINFNNLNLAAGKTYTATVWIDFVAGNVTNSSLADAGSLYYDPNNMNYVTTWKFDDQGIMSFEASPEGRDAYSGKVTFSIAEDGSYTVNGESVSQTSSQSISIIAKRPFGKVRIIPTDYTTKEDWINYFNAVSKINHTAITVIGLATQYSVLSESPISAPDPNKTYTMHREWYGSGNIDANAIQWVTETSTGNVYPVLDYNYLIPAANGTYAIGIKAFSFAKDENNAQIVDLNATDTRRILNKEISNVPVVANKLTTIKGHFLTVNNYNFSITINDNYGTTEDNVAP